MLELDRRNLTLLVEPGVTTQTIFDLADKAGLLYPPDPGSMKISTIGGNVAENSGGLRGLKYGVTQDYVMGFEIVLPNGEVMWIGNKCVKDVAGYSLQDIFIGSEGTLGVFTKILLRLMPKPAAKRTMLAVYAKMEQAAETVSAIIAHPIIPCTLEFLDRTTIHCVEDYANVGLPRDAEAMLLMETDGHPAVVAEEGGDHGAAGARAGRAGSARGGDGGGGAEAGHGAPLGLLRAGARRADDDSGGRHRAAQRAGRDGRVSSRTGACGTICASAVFGHMGDGNLHPTFLTNEKNAEEMHRVELAFKEIVTETVRRGGTITGEHGVGLAKKKFLRRVGRRAQRRA